MKLINLIFTTLLTSSCASITRFGGTEKYFKIKRINNIHAPYVTDTIMYNYSVRDDEETCFESNPDNKETITVNADHIEFALDHFYKRVSNIDVRLYKSDGSIVKTEVVATDKVNFDLEVAYCYMDRAGSVPWLDLTIKYVSFRLASDRQKQKEAESTQKLESEKVSIVP